MFDRDTLPGALSRRDVLRYGVAAGVGLSLPNVLRLRAAAATTQQPSPPSTSVIFVMMGGGPSHHETYDPKPDAPAEYRGPFQSIATSAPGVRFCELLPEQARIANELAVVRSVTHNEASHIALHMVETGYFLRDLGKILKGEMPAVGSVVARVRGPANGLPAFISLPKAQAYSGPIHLGGQYAAFDVNDDPADPTFRVKNLTLSGTLTPEVLEQRQSLLRGFDETRRAAEIGESAGAIDAFQKQALDLLTGERARVAFDVNRESDRLRDRYGRNTLGQRLLLARRLVEAGVPFVNVRTFGWDDHQNLAAGMKKRCPEYDTGVAALVADLRERGLKRDVLVVAMGEFGRTPKVNQNAGRDHWPSVASVLLAGGSYRMGQAIGASDSKGAYVSQSPYKPQNVLAMVYRHLGIDPDMTFLDFSGRPRHVLEEREPITELL